MSKLKKLFIVFEGIDGSGKSTQSKILHNRLVKLGYPSHHTAEPTKRPIGKMIREVFSEKLIVDELVVAGLFVADRLDHLLNHEDGIIDKLSSGEHVICDRYYLSSFAYQGVFTPMEWLIQANAKAIELLRPDITFYIDLDPKVSMQRINKERTSKEIYETLENLILVRNNYLKAIKLFEQKEKIITIDGSQGLETISEMIWNSVEELLV
ncbi:MAG: dTMP kinase [Saprospiraceae bacterium]